MKEVVVARRQPLDDIAQRVALGGLHLVDCAEMPFAQDHGFERPHRPERHDGNEGVVFAHHSFFERGFQLGVIAQQAGAMRVVIFLLVDLFRQRLVRNIGAGPDLAVRVSARWPCLIAPWFSKICT